MGISPYTKRKKNMKAKFNIIYVPDTINGKKNIEKKSVCRSGMLDEKSRVFTTTNGEIAFCYFDLDKNNYRTAKNKWTINLQG
jgi:hypothetical protein